MHKKASSDSIRSWIVRIWRRYRFLRYFLAGAPGLVVAVVSIWLLTDYLNWSHADAVLVMGIVGHVINFPFVKKVFFPSEGFFTKSTVRQFLKHIVVGVAASGASYFVLKYLDQKPLWTCFPVKLAFDGICTVGVYFLSDSFIFLPAKYIN